MKFDLFAIIMMIVAIVGGQFVGSYLIGFMGDLGGGIIGTFIVGVVCYLVYILLTRGKFNIVKAVIFSIMIYVANMLAGYVDQLIGLGGGILTLVLTGIIASLLWGWVGGRGKSRSRRRR